MIIGLTGKKGTGKSYCVRKLEKQYKNTSVVKFAKPLYDMQDAIYEIANLPYPDPKDRKLLQFLGTEWGRSIDKDLWINLWKDQANFLLSDGKIVLCDDIRFDNEAELVRNMGGIIIELTGPSRIANDGTENHASEKGIDKKYVDIFLEINDNIIKEVEHFMEKESVR